MITRLEVDGFKSLQGFAVDLEPFTVFIGPNGAGKSNILEALALLSRLAGGATIVDALRQGRGELSDQFSRLGGHIAQEMRIAIEFLRFASEGPPSSVQSVSVPTRGRYELIIERVTRPSGADRFMAREQLAWLPPGQDPWIVAHPEFAAFAVYSNSGAYEPNFSWEQAEIVPPSMRACQWIRLDLAHLAGSSDRGDTGALRSDGSNLPTVLADLPPPLVGEIRADVVALVPGLASFSIVPDKNRFEIEFELSGGETMPARLISDGTLRVLALLTAFRLEPRPFLIGIEEPENGIYPGRLRALVELLRRESEWPFPDEEDSGAPQVLLTTHSPVILAALRNHSQHLRYVDTVHRDLRRVTRARAVGDPSKDPRHLISPREIDWLLNAVSTEDPEWAG